MKVEQVSINDIKEYKNNIKLHDMKQVKNVAKSISDFGMIQPIVVDKEGTIIIGHCRYRACVMLDMDTVPVVRLEDLNDEEISRLRIVDNKLNESEWDFTALEMELKNIDLNDFDLDFDFSTLADKGAAFFNRDNRFDDGRQDGNDEYNEFVDKFEEKHTTDDCYTPDNIYQAVVDYVVKQYGVDESCFVRPFFPGGDYQAYTYDDDSIVVDNPPFSIISKIVNYYNERKIKYFLFAPALTLFSSSSSSSSSSFLCVGESIIYANGAKVATSFITNLEEYTVRTCPELNKAIKKANDDNHPKANNPIYEYPDNVTYCARLNTLSKWGVNFGFDKRHASYISGLDAQKKYDKNIFGSGFLLSEQKAAEQKAAEQKAAEQKAAEQKAAERLQVWELSKRELDIIKSLGGD